MSASPTLGPVQAAYAADGLPVARERFYALACDPQRSVVVEACAGAGKTWMLVSRILRALLDGAEPQQIVAITFTRKAAGEMRQRLGEWLDEFAHTDAAGRIAALQQRGMDAAAAAAAEPQLARLQQRLLAGGRMVEIRTFHAWFAQLLKAAPLELLKAQAIAPELQLLEDESELMPDVWSRFNAQVLADAGLLADYQALVLEHGRNRVRRWLEAGFAKRVELRLAAESGHLMEAVAGPEAVAPELAGLVDVLQALAVLRPRLQALARELGAAKSATPRKTAELLERALALAEPAEAFEALFAALFTATGTPRKHLGDSAELLALSDALQRLDLARQQQQARRTHQQLSRLALALLSGYEALKLARGLVDMNDLERGALALLADAELSGWVQERLDQQIRHLLIDEFQDTSPLQWHALHAWLDGYGGAGGGRSGQQPPAVFIVGDPKQSIYRFRRAEPRVFAAARDFISQALGGLVLSCDHTRRNAPAVLAAVNQVFDVASWAGEYSGFRAHSTESQPRADDGVHCLVDPGPAAKDEASEQDSEVWRPSLRQARHEPELHKRAAEAQRVASCIAAWLAEGQVLPGEIFVLARKREGLRVLAQTLKGLGIPHAAPEETPLLESPDVRDLLALLDVLASPGHNLSLAHALRSPLFAASEADLLWLAEQGGEVEWLDRPRPEPEQRRSWWAVLCRAEGELPGMALPRASRLLQRWQQAARSRSPHDLLDQILHEGELLQRLAAAVPPSERSSRLHAVQAVLALALDLDGGRYAGIYSFVRSLRSRALKLSWPSVADAVQLLTVHGAKGLEAQVVVLLDCEAAPARAETTTLAVHWPVQQARPDTVAFIASEGKPPPSLLALLDEEREQRQREELNALYVALTRARSRLVFSRTPSQRTSASASWWDRLQGQAQPLSVPATELAAPAGAPAAAHKAAATLRCLPELRLATPQAPLPQTEIGGAPVPVDDSAALGEALHRVLEWACRPAQRQSLESLLAAAAQMYGLDQARSQRLARSAGDILSSPECAPLLRGESLLWAGNEVAVSWRGQDLRIDRLVCLPAAGGAAGSVWWVLDYKLHPEPQEKLEYLAQLGRYREAVMLLQPGDKVRTAFVSGQGRLIDCTAAVEALPEQVLLDSA